MKKLVTRRIARGLAALLVALSLLLPTAALAADPSTGSPATLTMTIPPGFGSDASWSS